MSLPGYSRSMAWGLLSRATSSISTRVSESQDRPERPVDWKTLMSPLVFHALVWRMNWV